MHVMVEPWMIFIHLFVTFPQTLDCDQPQHVTVEFFAEVVNVDIHICEIELIHFIQDLTNADLRSWLLIFETETNAKNLTKAIKVCWEAEFGIEFEIRIK